MNNSSKTNSERVDALTDTDIDISDIPPLTDADLARVVVRLPGESIAVTVHVEPGVLAWFQAQGEDYERYMSAVLRRFANSHH